MINLRDVVQLHAGQVTPAELCARHGLSPEQLDAEVSRWEQRVAPGGARRGARGFRGAVVAALVLLGVGLTARSGFAQSACAQTLPAPLVTFCADAPARATEVNGNFQQLVTWVEQKVGTVGSAAVSISSLTTTGDVSVGGVLRAPTLNVSGTGTLATLSLGGDALTRFRTLPAQAVTATAGLGVSVWDVSTDAVLGAANRTVCFLQQQNHGVWATTFDDGATYSCRVFVEAGNWKVRAQVTRGHHQETSVSVTCSASCITWGT